MQRFLFTLLIIAIALPLQAQYNFTSNRLALDKWHDGEVTLHNGETLEGSINFNYLLNLVRLKADNFERVYNHKQVLEFWVYKPEEERKVFYKSLNLRTGDQIYEVVGEDDEKALLVATVVDTKSYTYPNNPGPNNISYGTNTETVHRKAEAFFIITNQGTIYELGRIVITRNNKGQLKSTIKRKKLAQILKQFKPDIEEYLETNKINLKKRPQLIETFKSILNER